MDTGKIIDGQFKLLKLIGRGYTSKVFLTEHTKTNKKVALKLYKRKDYTPNEFKIEVESMQKVKHPNVLQIHAANNKGIQCTIGKKDKPCVYIVIEIAENAELFDFISEPDKGFPENVARYFFLQIINGLKSIHENGFAHRDLKTENVFLDKNFTIKIGDFGFSKSIENTIDNKLSTVLGTIGYQSPELLEGKHYSGIKNDIFACGVILFIIVNGYPPFREAKNKDPWYKQFYLDTPGKFWEMHGQKLEVSSPSFIGLINGMLSFEEKRLSIDQILTHEWLKGDLPSENDFFREMSERKLIVDRSRKRATEENGIDLKECESKIVVSKQYRGKEDNDESGEIELINSMDLSNFKSRTLNDSSNKYTINFNNDIVSSFKFICVYLKKIFNASTEILDKSFKIKSSLDFIYFDENINEELTEELSFTVEIFQEKLKGVAVFTLSNNSNQFIFKKFYSSLLMCLIGDYSSIK